MNIYSTRDLAAVVRGRRKDLGLSQIDLARRAGVSRKWLMDVEAGKPTLEFGLLLRVLDALGLQLQVLPAGTSSPSGEPKVDLDALLDRHRRP